MSDRMHSQTPATAHVVEVDSVVKRGGDVHDAPVLVHNQVLEAGGDSEQTRKARLSGEGCGQTEVSGSAARERG
jgi:hypothetical protein